MRINLVHTEVSSKYSADKITIWEGAGLLFFFIIIINHCFVCYLVVWYKCTIETIDPMSKDKPVRSVFLVSCNQRIGFNCGFPLFCFFVGDFACVVNTSHRQVSSQLEWALKQAETHLNKGNKFCIEVMKPRMLMNSLRTLFQKADGISVKYIAPSRSHGHNPSSFINLIIFFWNRFALMLH